MPRPPVPTSEDVPKPLGDAQAEARDLSEQDRDAFGRVAEMMTTEPLLPADDCLLVEALGESGSVVGWW